MYLHSHNLNIANAKSIAYKIFEEESGKLGISLQTHDKDLIKRRFTDPNHHSNVMYEDVIKALVPMLCKNQMYLHTSYE